MSCDHSAHYLKGCEIRCALCDLAAAEKRIEELEDTIMDIHEEIDMRADAAQS
jgi:hypothetical protein